MSDDQDFYAITVYKRKINISIDSVVYAHFHEQFMNPTGVKQKARLKTLNKMLVFAYLKGQEDRKMSGGSK